MVLDFSLWRPRHSLMIFVRAARRDLTTKALHRCWLSRTCVPGYAATWSPSIITCEQLRLCAKYFELLNLKTTGLETHLNGRTMWFLSWDWTCGVIARCVAKFACHHLWLNIPCTQKRSRLRNVIFPPAVCTLVYYNDTIRRDSNWTVEVLSVVLRNRIVIGLDRHPLH